MEYEGNERRGPERSYAEPYDSGTFLEFTLEGAEYRFMLLDTSPSGMGMLVKNEESDILKKLNIKDNIEMKYGKPDTSIFMNFEIRHITSIKRGPFKGHFQVGLSLVHSQG
jgi:hypothetical protein